MPSPGGDLPETSWDQHSMLACASSASDFSNSAWSRAERRQLRTSETVKIWRFPLYTPNYLFLKKFEILEQQLVAICLGCYKFAIFLTNHSKNFPKYPWNIPQTPNQQFEGIPFIWGFGDSWGMLPRVCWCSPYSCFPPDLHTIMAMTKFSGPSAAKFLFILKDLRAPAEVSAVSLPPVPTY